MAKAKALISCAVTAQLICVFAFAYANSRVSHNEAHIIHKGCDNYPTPCYTEYDVFGVLDIY